MNTSIETPPVPTSDASRCAVVELRQYTLHPGTRETLIALFERELVESQEAVGAMVVAQFRDVDRPDAFTWIRGFASMPARAAALGAFYDGPAWAAHRDAANATMVRFDNVRLLRPARDGGGFALLGARAPIGATAAPPDLVVATIYTLAPEAAPGFPDFFERVVQPRLVATGARPVAAHVTEESANDFPRLPVREGEHAFVWFARFADVAAHAHHVATLDADPHWRETARPALERRLAAPVEVWRLTPTPRSRALP